MENSNFVNTVEDRIQNAILSAIDNIVAPKMELAIRSINASSGRDVASVAAKSDSREHVVINAFLENASGNNNIQQVSNENDNTRNNITDEVRQLSVPETRFDRQTHTYHMVTRHKTQTNQTPEFLTRPILTPRNRPSHQHKNLSKQVSQENNLPIVEQTPRNQNSDVNNSISRLVNAIAGKATQQRPQAASMLIPVSTNTKYFDGKNQQFELFADLIHTVLEMQPDMTENMKVNHFHAHHGKKHFKHLEIKVQETKKTSMTC